MDAYGPEMVFTGTVRREILLFWVDSGSIILVHFDRRWTKSDEK